MKISHNKLWLIGIVVASSIVGFYYFFGPGLAKYLKMIQQDQFLDQRVVEEEQKKLRLKKEHEALSQDPVSIERIAREKLGFSRPGEIIYSFEEEPTSPSPSSEAAAK